MELVRLDSIVIGANRQRREFDPNALRELSVSIRARGLMHAPVVRVTVGEGGKPTGYALVAGERRLRAIADLHALGEVFLYAGRAVPEGFVPVVPMGALSPMEAEEAELEENVVRRDLTWQEQADATRRLHELRMAQANARALLQSRAEGEVRDERPHTIADTALEIKGRTDGSFQDSVRKSLIVARHLDNPEVKAAKSVDEAFKVLKRQEERQKNVELAERVGKVGYDSSVHTVMQANCCEWMKDALLTTGMAFDVILTDPPYGMGAQDFGDAGGKVQEVHRYDDSPDAWHKLMSEWAPLSFAIAKPQAHLYAFCDIDRFHHLRDYLTAAGWRVHRTPLVLHKTTATRVPWPQHGPRRHYELVAYAVKGDRPVNHIGPDVFSAAGDENLGHGAQKPVAAYVELLRRSVRPGDRVLDCFAGTGPIIPAAHQLKCYATAIEQDTAAIGICHKRLAGLDNGQKELFL